MPLQPLPTGTTHVLSKEGMAFLPPFVCVRSRLVAAFHWYFVGCRFGEHFCGARPHPTPPYRIPGRHQAIVQTGIGLRRSQVRSAMILAS